MKKFLSEEATKNAPMAGIDDEEEDEVPSNLPAVLIQADPDEVDDEEESPDAVIWRKDRDSSETRAVTRRQAASDTLQKATVSFNPIVSCEAPTAIEEDDAVQMVFTAELNSDPGEPKTLDEALN
jgi:hypothetical protein